MKKVKCPLCQELMPLNTITEAGCITCSDERDKARKNHYNSFLPARRKQEEISEAHYQRFLKSVDLNKELAVERERKALERAEQKRVHELNREQSSIALARRSLLHYIERRQPSYKPGWAHEVMANELERFVQDVADKKSPRLILSCCSRLGKEVSDFTEVFTTEGWKLHGNLKVGDYVFDIEGNPTMVEVVADPIPCDMEIEFNNGTVVQTHSNHEWVVYDRSYKHKDAGYAAWRVFETKELFTTRTGQKRSFLMYRNEKSVGAPRYRMPVSPRLSLPDIDLPMDPYVLGCWLGDGTSNAPVITHHPAETEVIAEIVCRGYEKTYSAHNFAAGSCQTRFGRTEAGPSQMREDLKQAGVLNNKHIPPIYFRAGTQQRLELLAGLLDTDGTLDKSSRYTFASASPQLRNDFMELARGLGFKPYYSTIQPRMSTSGIQGRKEYYEVGFQPNTMDIPTVLPRKKIFRTAPVQSIGISNIRPIQDGPLGRCIQVASPTGTYCITKDMIPTHNSELASNSLPAWALGAHPEWKFIVTSYSDKLPSVFSRSIRDQLRSDEYRKIFPNGAVISADDSSVMNWSTTQGGGVRAVGVGGSLMGFGTDVLILDDIVKDSVEADNPEAMDQSFDFFSSVAYSRLLPGAGVLIIQQRMSIDDLIGRVQQQQFEEEAKIKELHTDAEDLARESELGMDDPEVLHMIKEAEELDASMDRWRVVEFPALAKQDEYYDRDAGNLIGVPPGTAPEPHWKPLRKIGEAIHPERYTRSYYLKIKRSNPRRFSSMFQLDPIADGSQYFDVKLVNRYSIKKRPKHLHIVTAWDLAIGTKQHNDFTVGVALGMDPQRRVYLLDRVKGKFGDVRQVSDMLINLHLKWDSSITGVEKNHIETAMGPILRSRMHERGDYITLAEGKEALRPMNDKKIRARTLQGWVQAGLIYVPEGEDWDEYIVNLSRFGSSNHDDDVDATAWAAILLARTPPPIDPSEERKKSAAAKAKSWWDEMINEMTGGQNTGYMES